MKKQLVKIERNGEYRVIYDDQQKVNPYKIVYTHYVLTKYGLRESRKQIAKYANFSSCMYYLWQLYSSDIAG